MNDFYREKLKIFYLICFFVLAAVCVKTSAFAQENADQPKAALSDILQGGVDDQGAMLARLGLPKASEFTLGKIAAYVIFGSIGFIAFLYGKKNRAWRAMAIGIALMVYPYFGTNTLGLYLVGGALTAALYFWRD